MADCLNLQLILPRMKKMLRYLGQSNYGFELSSHGLSGTIPARDITHFLWRLEKPDVFRVYAHGYLDNVTGSHVDAVELEVQLKGRPLEELYRLLNDAAYNKAQKEYFHEAVMHHLSMRLNEI